MYPLQLLTGNVLLAAILGMSATTQLQAVVGREPMPAASTPSVLQMPPPQGGTKCQHHSSNLRQEEEETAELDDTSKKHPHQRQKEGRLVAKLLKDSCQEAFSKELEEVIKAARWAYYRIHHPNFEQERSHDLSSTVWEMANMTNLLGTEIHEVQESWTSQKDLKATYQSAKSSPKAICFFRVVLPTKSPRIMA